jgi:hypothetical protein
MLRKLLPLALAAPLLGGCVIAAETGPPVVYGGGYYAPRPYYRPPPAYRPYYGRPYGYYGPRYGYYAPRGYYRGW